MHLLPPICHRQSTQFRPEIAPNLEAWYDVSAVENSGNSVKQSEDFNLVWTRSALNAFGAVDTGAAGAGSFANTSRTLDPLGGNTADFVQEDATVAGLHYISQSSVPVVSLVASHRIVIYAKAAGRTRGRIYLVNTAYFGVYFDLTAVTTAPYTGGGGSVSASSITDAGNGWYRIEVTGSAAWAGGPNLLVLFEDAAGAAPYNGNNTSGFFFWGASVQLASWDSRYIPTGANPIFPNAQADGANAVVNLRNLAPLNDGRGNLLLQSQDFQTTWTRARLNAFGAVDTGAAGAGSFANTTRTLDPLGGNTADFIQEDGTVGNTHYITQDVTTGSGTYVLSVYAKAAGRDWILLNVGNNTTFESMFGYFNISSGTLGLSGGLNGATGVSSSISSVGDGWYLCKVTGTLSASALFFGRLWLAEADNDTSFDGNNTTGAFIWGAHLRRSSWPADYVRTITDTVTPYRNGSFRDLYQGTGSAQPTLTVGPSGRNTVTFNGIAHFLKTPTFPLQQPVTVYLAFRPVTNIAFSAFMDGNSPNMMFLYQTGVNRWAMNAGIDVTITDPLPSEPSRFNIASTFWSGPNSGLNADRPYLTNVGTAAPNGFTLAARGAAANFSNIQVGEVLIFSVLHDQNTRARVLRYLSDKWNVV